jgi:hypothetical protein
MGWGMRIINQSIFVTMLVCVAVSANSQQKPRAEVQPDNGPTLSATLNFIQKK